MIKLSDYEKKRRKEEAIYKRYDHYLCIMWACRDGTEYNGKKWSKNEMHAAYYESCGFVSGCAFADGRKWYERLAKRYAEFEKLHGKLMQK